MHKFMRFSRCTGALRAHRNTEGSRRLRYSYKYLPFTSFSTTGKDASANSGEPSLMDTIYTRIKYTGPMTVADYMREVLTHPTKGYYMKGDVFGRKGDYITSPEINQVFGELMAVWILAQWIAADRPQPCQLVELGPGRGTLMRDILRVFKQFPGTVEAFSIRLVEVSSAMRVIQGETLKSSDGTVVWHDSIKDVPRNRITFYVAHEFFDALPLHQFQFTDNGWREVLVDINKSEKLNRNLRFVLAPGPTFSSTVYTKGFPQDGTLTKAEVSPSLLVTSEEISQRIHKDGGAALIVDYGEEGLNDFTLRAFKDHKPADLLSDLGSADLTADVDFALLKRITQREEVLSHGPMTQNEFLHKMGIRQRLDTLLKTATAAQSEDILSAYDMLTNDKKMGKRFKMFAITRKGQLPVPF